MELRRIFKKMRLMLCGSRDLVDHANIRRVLDVVHGKVPIALVTELKSRLAFRPDAKSEVNYL
jgi:hypothetical protein